RAEGAPRTPFPGSSTASRPTAIALVAPHPRVSRCTAGGPPQRATELDERALAELGRRATAPEVVAVGECGLDYFRDYSPRDVQREAFHRQLELAARVGKPVFLHQRDAHDDFVAILREHLPRLSGGVAHCFTGTRPELECYLDMGLAIGITGWICDER